MAADPFEQIAKFVKAVQTGLSKGVASAMKATPVLIRGQFQALANQRLNTSRDDYMTSLSMEFKQDILVVEIDDKNFLAKAVEEGLDPYDMHEMLNTSSKVKYSKKGFRYLRIPMQKTKSKTFTSPSDKGEQLNQKIRDALSGKAMFSFPFARELSDGSGMTTEQYLNSANDPDLKGLLRVRRFKSPEDIPAGKPPISSQFILMRTISTNPLTKSAGGWQHPGVKPRRLFPDVERWANATLPDLLAQIVDSAVKKELDKL